MDNYIDEWVILREVADVYDELNINSIQSYVSNARRDGKDVSMWYKNNGNKGGEAIINIGYLKYVWNRRRRIQFQAQDWFYELLDIVDGEDEKHREINLKHQFAKYAGIGYVCASDFIEKQLFRNYYFLTLSNLHISTALLTFHRFCSELITPIIFENVTEECDYNELQRILNVA